MSSVELIILAAPVVLVALVIVLARRRRAGSADGLPVCGRCGYCVRGVPSFTCPECGSDLREVGILTADVRRPLSPYAWAAIWTLVLPAPAVLLSHIYMSTIGPAERVRTMQRVIFCQSDDLNATVRVEMTGSALRWFGSRQPVFLQRMKLSFDHPAGGPTMQVDLDTGGYEYTTKDGKEIRRASGFGLEALASWLAAAGIDTSPEDVQKRIVDLHTAIAETPSTIGKFTRFAPHPEHGLPRITAHPTNDWTRPRRLPWLSSVCAAFWILVWLIGVIRIFRRARARQAAAQAG